MGFFLNKSDLSPFILRQNNFRATDENQHTFSKESSLQNLQ